VLAETPLPARELLFRKIQASVSARSASLEFCAEP
jgi:hypothetical protein